jgi:hypothetical protein
MNPCNYAHLIFDKVAKNIWWRKDRIVSKCIWEKWLIDFRKLQLDPWLSPCVSINLKWFKDLNNRPETEVSTRKSREYTGSNTHRQGLLQ